MRVGRGRWLVVVAALAVAGAAEAAIVNSAHDFIDPAKWGGSPGFVGGGTCAQCHTVHFAAGAVRLYARAVGGGTTVRLLCADCHPDNGTQGSLPRGGLWPATGGPLPRRLPASHVANLDVVTGFGNCTRCHRH